MIPSTFKAAGCLLFVFCISVWAQTPAKKTATGTITGKVTLKGEGIAGIPVGARDNKSDNPRRPVITATTDSQGNYRITNLPPGTYEIEPGSPQFVVAGRDARRTLILNEGETFDGIDFALVRGGVITGRLIDSEGRPVIEENVQITSPDGVPLGSFVGLNLSYGPTDDRGVYRVYGLPPGKYRVSAGSEERLYYDATGRNHYKQTFHPSTTDPNKATLVEVTEGGETTNVDIAFRKPQATFTVSGKVVDADTGTPIPNVVYGLQKNFKNGSQANSGMVTTSRGEFRFESVTPGSYSVFIASSPALELHAEPIEFEVTDQNITGLIIKASPGSKINGVIVVEGMDEKAGRALLNGGVVLVESDNGQERTGYSNRPVGAINADGSFQLTGTPPGRLDFLVFPDPRGGRPCEIVRIERNGVVQSGGVELKDREQISNLRLFVKYHRGSIRGVVKFENGELLANESVSIFVSLVGDERAQMSEQPDPRGRFVLDGLKPGVYELTAVAYLGTHHVRASSAKYQVVVSDNQVSEVMVKLDLGVKK